MAPLTLGRRGALLGLTAAWTTGLVSLALADAPVDRRFVVVILRGALDGLAAVIPYGDPNLAAWRRGLIPGPAGSPGGMLDLGGFFGLHPALAGLHDLYAQGALLPVHAVAGHYRSRSHFEAQDYLESGADHRMTSGWLNRVVAALPATLRRGAPEGAALSLGLSMPLLLRGPAPVGSWAPSGGARPSPDLYARIAQLNAADALTGPAILGALRTRGFSAEVLQTVAPASDGRGGAPAPRADGFAGLAHTCGLLLAAPHGPRVAALELGGWDTHSTQMARLTQPLQELSAGLLGLRDGLGSAWASTVVLVMTEFGRTVRVNGTLGTDHGTGGVAFALGGPIMGGRVGGTWPGLARANLFEDRDLQPTTDLRGLAKGLLAAHFGLGAQALGQIFPDSGAVAPMRGIVRV